MKTQRDALWKTVLEPFFHDFLKFIDPILAARVDETRPVTFLDKELIPMSPNKTDIYEVSIVDKLVKLYTNEGVEEWILLHLEVQHKYTKDFNERMYRYFNRLYDKYNRPITAYAMFTEPNKIKRDNVFKYHCSGTTLQYSFNTFKIAFEDTKTLLSNPNPFALVLLIAKLTELKQILKNESEYDQVLLGEKLKIGELINKRNLSTEKKDAVINFLFNYVDFDLKETNAKFEEQINSLYHNYSDIMTVGEQVKLLIRSEGKREGKREGIREAKEDEVLRLITKFHLTDEEIIEFASVTPSLVKRIRKKIKEVN